MNYRLILKNLARVLRIEAVALTVPALVSAFYGGEGVLAFLAAAGLAGLAGLGLGLLKPERVKMKHKEGFVTAAAAWGLLSLFGAVPFWLSGCFRHFGDCLFEAVGGFTTTGATVLADVESLPRAVLFWRAETQWLGGMGVLMLMIALTSAGSASAINMMQAEAQGPLKGKIVPRMKESARILYIVYCALTGALFVALLLTGMPVFDAMIHAMGTAGTGGSSPLNAGVGGYDMVAPTARWVILAFMFVFGVNYGLLYTLWKRDWKTAVKDEELRLYVVLVIAATALCAVGLTRGGAAAGEAVKKALFQVVSMITTTGYYTEDFTAWPAACGAALTLLMIVGGCAGSTSGGVKVSRLWLTLKAVRGEMTKIAHPRAVKPISMNGKPVDDHLIRQVLLFFTAYGLIAAAAALVLSFDTGGLETSFSAVIAAMSNIGPGYGDVGPNGGYGEFSALSKITLGFCMLAGRLEFYPLLVVFTPGLWRGKA